MHLVTVLAADAAKRAYRASKSTNHYTGFGVRPLTHLQHTSRKKPIAHILKHETLESLITDGIKWHP